MEKRIFWIQGPWLGRIAIVLRPPDDRWLDEVIGNWRASGLDIVISLLTPPEVAHLRLEREREVAMAHGLQFHSFPIADFGVPSSPQELQHFAQQAITLLNEGKNIAVHCWHSIGRSSLLSASLLVSAGVSAQDAFARIQLARGCPVPETELQREWVERFAMRQPMSHMGTS